MASNSILTCPLTDDHLAQVMEIALLQRWGFSEDFAKMAYNRERTSGENGVPEACHGQCNLTTSPGGQSTETVKSDDKGSLLQEPCLENNWPDHVRDLYKLAQASYKAEQYCDSLIYIEDALETDKQMAKKASLWSLRAKVMNAMEDYLETLKSVDNVMVEERSQEICLEGVIALQKLGLLYTAEQWLKQIIMGKEKINDDDDGRKWSQKVMQFFHDIRNSRIFGPLIKDTPIKISVSKNVRSVRASRNISKGEIIFTEVPELLEQTIATHNITACAHCGLSLMRAEDVFSTGHLKSSELQKVLKKLWPKRAIIPCGTCDRVAYCSESCQKEAWNNYHKLICPSSSTSTSSMLYDIRKSFRDVMAANGSTWQGWWNAEFSPILMARMWGTVVIQSKCLVENNRIPDGDNWLRAWSQFEKYSLQDDISASSSIPKMYELMSNIFKRCKFLRYEITENDFSKRYEQILTNYISFHDVSNPLHQFVDKVTKDHKLYKRIGKYFQEPLPKAEFHGLFPLASCFNHSCFPNAEIISGVVQGKPGILVQALRDISVFDEIVISYVNPKNVKHERLKILLRKYKFLCQCVRCLYEGDGPDICTHCGKYSVAAESPKEEESFVTNRQKVHLMSAMEELQDNPDKPHPLIQQSPFTYTDKDTGKSEEERHYQMSEQNSGAECQKYLLSHAESVSKMTSLNIQEDIPLGDISNSLSSETSKEETTDFIEDVSHKVTELSAAEKCKSDVDTPIVADEPTAELNELKISTAEESNSAPPNMAKESNRKLLDQNNGIPTAIDNSTATVTSADTTGILSGTKSSVISKKKFPHCGRCGRAWYCSQQCQKEAWKKGHKKICGKY